WALGLAGGPPVVLMLRVAVGRVRGRYREVRPLCAGCGYDLGVRFAGGPAFGEGLADFHFLFKPAVEERVRRSLADLFRPQRQNQLNLATRAAQLLGDLLRGLAVVGQGVDVGVAGVVGGVREGAFWSVGVGRSRVWRVCGG